LFILSGYDYNIQRLLEQGDQTTGTSVLICINSWLLGGLARDYCPPHPDVHRYEMASRWASSEDGRREDLPSSGLLEGARWTVMEWEGDLSRRLV
jgi:hypothetical protein